MCNDREGNLITDKSQVARRWKQHFEVVLNGEEGRRVVEGNRIEIGEYGQAADPPTLDEVKNACKELKTHKAAGKDGLPAELFKVGSERLCSAIHQIILRVWSEEQLPTDWLEGLICPIYKKGHRLDCSNYRGITLLNSAYKILSRILFLTEAVAGSLCWRIPMRFSSGAIYNGPDVYLETDSRPVLRTQLANASSVHRL